MRLRRRLSRVLVPGGALIATSLVVVASHAQSASDPVSTQAISVPTGEGTIEGLGESFSAQPSTGIATFQLPIQQPKARGGVQPSLALSYKSSAGTGNAGIGWNLAVPFIARELDRGLPQYNDPVGGAFAITQDRFVFNGGQELVPLGVVASGACAAAPGEAFPAWANGWQYFRARVEGAFERFFWSADHRTWRVYDKSGASLEFGVPLDGSGRTDALEVSPANAASIYRWNVARAYDDEGGAAPLGAASPAPVNVVAYAYEQQGNLAWLSDVYDTPPASGSATAPVSAYAHHVHLVYQPRPDPITSFRRGWETQDTQRVARIDVASQALAATGPRELVRRYDLAYIAGSRASLLASVTREGRCAAPVQEDSTGVLPYSQACPALPPVAFAYTQGGRPGVTPTPFQDLGTFDETVVSLPSAPTTPMSDPYTDFLDVNGDALPDILRTQSTAANAHQVYFNGANGTASFGAVSSIGMQAGAPISAATLSFAQKQVATLDADGDAIIDLAYVPAAPTGYIASSGQVGTVWQWLLRAMETPNDGGSYLNLSGGRPNIRIFDVNGDGLVDIVESTTSNMRTFFNLGKYPGGDGHFGTAMWTSPTTATLTNAPALACVPGDSQPVQFAQSAIQTADMNGDGLVDLVRVMPAAVQYWPGRGDGTWGLVPPNGCPGTTRPLGSVSQVSMATSPTFSLTTGQQRLIDMNRDGLDDLVIVQSQQVTVYFNLAGAGFSSAFTIGSTPAFNAAVVRTVDVDGSGTPDIVWGNQSNYQYLDILGGSRPRLLSHIDNGLGKTTDITYATTTSLMTAAAKAGQPWASTIPVARFAVTKIVTSDNLPVAGRAANTLETDYTYRDAVWDVQRREFRGFRQVAVRTVGDANTPPSTATTNFLTGDCVDELNDGGNDCTPSGRWRDNPREALKGLAVATETFDDHGVYLSTNHTTYTLQQLYAGLDGRLVRQAFSSATDSWLYDTYSFTSASAANPIPDVVLAGGAAGTVPSSALTLRSVTGRAHLQTTRAVDSFGNATAETRLGCVDGCAVVDEVVTSSAEFVVATGDTSGWLYRTSHSWVQGTRTPARHEQFITYDDRGRARVTRATLLGTVPLHRFHEAALLASDGGAGSPAAIAPAPSGASADGQIVTAASDYDAFGNIAFARASDNRCRTLAYDAAFAQLPVTETVYVGAVGKDEGASGSMASAAFASTPGGAGCGTTPLAAIAAYDRGLGKATQVTDIHGETTSLQVDGLGRPTALYRPDPNLLGLPEANPSVLVTYDLDSTGARRYSVIHTQTLDGASVAAAPDAGASGTGVQLRDAWAYVDGLGRTVVTLEQADPSAGDQAAWVVHGLAQHDAKGNAIAVFLPWFSAATASAYPLSTPPVTTATQHQFDAFNRETQTIDTGGDVAAQYHFHALATDTWDAADLGTTSHAGTFATIQKDGLGRTIASVERLNVGGALTATTTATTFLATGEPLTITRTAAGSPTITRQLAYDSIGRMVQNLDPHTTKGYGATANGATVPLLYAYDDAGEVVGTSDARGCGVNYFYDAGGRRTAEDYSPCLNTQLPYSAPNLATGDGTEVFSRYDSLEPDASPACPQSPSLLLGRLASISDRASRLVPSYDARGRKVCASRRVANPGPAATALSLRYASNWFSQEVTFDDADRSIRQTTGAISPELLGSDGTSATVTSYTQRGLVAVAGSSYGPLVSSVVHDASGLPLSVAYGDLAGTATAITYDVKQRVQTLVTQRGPPALWSNASGSYTPPVAGAPSTLQPVLEDLVLGYDQVSNPVSIQDLRDPAAWPAGAKPVSRAIAYDDLYRVTNVSYSYATTPGDAWVSPFDAENTGTEPDPRRPVPAPHVSFPNRVQQQTFAYDAYGSTTDVEDDARGFYDRSLGAVTSNAASGRPYQLASASNELGESSNEGALAATYDDGGYMTGLTVARNGACLPVGAVCSQRFVYDWDEVGNLARAQRWDVSAPGAPTSAIPTAAPAVDLAYAYDVSAQRVLKAATSATGMTSYAVYPSIQLELRGATFNGTAYAQTAQTEVPYLYAHGVRIARVAYAIDDVPTLTSGKLHVYLELQDRLASTGVVLDKDTGELVERTTYMPYGGTDSDYRPQRWASFREDHRFTGKEDDAEVGLTYFGKRYLSPALGRWISADPLAAHSPGSADLNLYAYVGGRVFVAVDVAGLDGESPWSLANLAGYARGAATGAHASYEAVAHAIDHPIDTFSAVKETVVKAYDEGGMVGVGKTLVVDPIADSYHAMKAAEAAGNYDAAGKAAWDTAFAIAGTIDGAAGAKSLLKAGATTIVDAGKAVVARTGIPVIGIAAGGAGVSLVKITGSAGAETGEVFYRTMSPAHADELMTTGRLPATSETFISPTQAFAEGYDGVTMKLTLKPGTTEQLASMGVRDSSAVAAAAYPDMAGVGKGWTKTSAFFKGEGEQLNIGLGRGKALDLFNDNILDVESIQPSAGQSGAVGATSAATTATDPSSEGAGGAE